MKSILKKESATIREMLDVAQDVALQQNIRARAYELYQRRGGEDGHELDDWLQAESEVNSKVTAA